MWTLPLPEEDLLLHLFQKGVQSQWTAADWDWEEPLCFTEAQCRAIARMLTPVFLGEQTAMLGAASVMPELARRRQHTAVVYLGSFMTDEARHLEALTRLYGRLGHDPIGIREMPEMLRYHHRLRQGDALDWAWGILISDIFAKHFYRIFARQFPAALFGRMSQRIIVDEGRHQAFASEFLRRRLPEQPPERRQALLAMRDELLSIMAAMHRHLVADCAALAVDGRAFFEALAAEIEHWARRVGVAGPGGGPGAGPGQGAGPGAPGKGQQPAAARQGLAAAPAARGQEPAAAQPAAAGGASGPALGGQGQREVIALPSPPPGRPWLKTCAGCALGLFCTSRLALAPIAVR